MGVHIKFEIESVDSSFGREFSVYMRDKNKSDVRLIFEEMSENNEMNVDTENAKVYYTEIHGNTALVSVKTGVTIVTWNEQNRMFSVIIDGEAEKDALKVAKSVTRIK